MLNALMPNGHLNVTRRDHDSAVTGYGTHDRVVCFLPQGGELYMRIDHKWGLGTPTVPEMLAAARKNQGVTGRWQLLRMEGWPDGRSTDVYFQRI